MEEIYTFVLFSGLISFQIVFITLVAYVAWHDKDDSQ